jgi:hypothetical protein
VYSCVGYSGPYEIITSRRQCTPVDFSGASHVYRREEDSRSMTIDPNNVTRALEELERSS